MSTPQITLQNLTPKLTEPGTTPLVGLLLETLIIEEGSAALIKVKRKVISSGECSVDWAVDAPGGLLATPAAGQVLFETGVTEMAFSIGTNVQTGTQGERTITIRLINPVGCELIEGQDTASLLIKDKSLPVTGWWQAPRRSGRASASGVGYEFGAATGELAQKVNTYETLVAYTDGNIAWTVDPEQIVAIPPSVTAVADFYNIQEGTGTEDLDVLANDSTVGGNKKIISVTPAATPSPPIAASELSIVGTAPTEKIRVKKSTLLPARKYNFSYRLALENDFGVFGDANVELSIIKKAAPGSAVIPYPTTANTVELSTGATPSQLMDAYNALVPNSTLIVPPKVFDFGASYAGITFGRSTGINQSNPIVIRVKDNRYTEVEFKNRIRLTGPDHTLIGAFVSQTRGSGNASGMNAGIEISGARSRASRVRVYHTPKSAANCITICKASDVIVDFFECWNPWGGGDGQDGRGICLETASALPKNFKIIRGYCRDFNENVYVNFHEPIQLGRGGKTYNYYCNGLVLECLVIRCDNEGESISVKSAGNEIRGACLVDCGNNSRFTNRFSTDSKWIACISKNSDGFNDRGFSTLYHSCLIEGGGSMELNSGDYTKAQWQANAASGGFPASTDAMVYYCNGPLALGPSGKPDPCANPVVRAHTGAITYPHVTGQDVKAGDPPPASAGARITPYLLQVADVGPVSAAGPN